MMMQNEDLGKLILRLAVGGLMIFHGIAKAIGGIDFMDGMLAAKGLPAFIKYGAYLGEIVAPALLLLGFQTRAAAGVLLFNMLMAIFLAHSQDIFSLSKHGGLAIELPLFFVLGALALIFLGGGRYALDARKFSS